MIITNIGRLTGILDPSVRCLRGREMDDVYCIDNAWLRFKDGVITGFGEMRSCPVNDEVVDAEGGIVIPAFCDSHTHIVWAGDRSGEFVDKIEGKSYEEIAANGGGILNSSDLLNSVSDDELYTTAARRLRQVMAMGTGAIEIKTGYGLTLEGELKMLRVIERLRDDFPMMEIKATFLGAHAVGRAYAGRQGEYVRHVVDDMLPQMAGRADFVDVFCDKGFFTVEETDSILKAAASYGMKPKIHANELDCSGGVQVGVDNGALSVDHLERIGEEEIKVLAASDTVATMLPGASFFLGMPYGPARKAVDEGCTVALASDYNPGSSPSGSMPFVMSLGCITMKLSPERAFNAVTINGAAARGLAGRCGSMSIGKNASFIIYKSYAPSLPYIIHAYSEPTIAAVYLKGERI